MAEKGETKSKEKTTGKSKLNGFLVFLVIALAFGFGVLWQRVQFLEDGKVAGSAESPTTNTNTKRQPSKLADLNALAQKVDVNESDFETCIESEKYAQKVISDQEGGAAAGVTGTPGNIVVNEKGEAWLIPGALPFEQLKPVVDAALGNGSAAEGKLPASEASKIPEITAEDHVRGNPNASVKLIEYSDYECPYCKSFHPTAQRLMTEYEGQIAWVYRHFPLDRIHPNARPAAIASECIADLAGEDAFWEFTDMVFAE